MRHGTPKLLIAGSIATLALATIGCGSSDDPAGGDRAAATTATAAATAPPIAPTTTAATAPPAETTTAATTSTPASTTPSTTTSSNPRSIVGSNGKMYRCIGSGLLRDLRTTSRRIDRGRRSLKRIRTELRQIKRRYPSKVAPQRIAQRYNYLVRKHNALLRLGNRRVRVYNARLERDCVKG